MEVFISGIFFVFLVLVVVERKNIKLSGQGGGWVGSGRNGKTLPNTLYEGKLFICCLFIYIGTGFLCVA